MEKPIKSKKLVIALEILSIVLVLAGFGAMALCDLFKNNGYGDFWFPLVGLIALGVFGILGIVLLFSIREDAITHEIEAKEKKLDALPLKSLSGLFQGSIEERFLSNHFEDAGDGYLRKKMFSAAKDSICYYVKCIDSEPLADAFPKATDAIEQRDERGSVCLLLFLSKSNIDSAALDELRELSKILIVSETTIPTPVAQSCVPVLIDSSTNEGRFLDTMGKYPVSVYTHGCKLLNRIFS